MPDEITLDTVQDGLIRVERDGTLVSEHQREDKAISSGYRAKGLAPASEVRIVRPDLRVEGAVTCPEVVEEEPTEPEPEPTGDVALTFESRWETALGTSDEALLDGGRWDGFSPCSFIDQVLEVVDGADHGLPGYNALQVKSRGENCGAVIKNAVADRAQSVYGRMYLMNEASSGHSWNHPIAHDYVGSIEATFSIWPQSGGVWRLKFSNGGDHEVSSKDNWFASDDGGATRFGFTNGEWYRLEYFVDIQNSNGDYKLYLRVYDSQGILLFDEGDFWHVDSGTQLSAMNEQGNFHMNPSSEDGAEEFREFGIGSEGPLSHPDDGESYFAAAVAFSTEGWIGSQGGPF